MALAKVTSGNFSWGEFLPAVTPRTSEHVFRKTGSIAPTLQNTSA
jgi:hypothetical protein